MSNQGTITTDPRTGVKTYRLKGEVVNKETFIATAVVQVVANVMAILLVSKALGISKGRAWALVAAVNTIRGMDDIRVDVADAAHKPMSSVQDLYRRNAGLN